MKRKNKRLILVTILVPCLIVIGVLSFLVLRSFNSFSQGEQEEIIKNDHYSLRSEATDYQTLLYDELTLALNDGTSDENIAALVVKNYVADFYTWTNKQGPHDVGGIEYVYGGYIANFYNGARDLFYYNLHSYIEDFGSENLIEVKNVEAKGSYAPQLYEYDGKTFESFYVEATWEYTDKPESNFEINKYQTKGYFDVIKNESGRFEIVNTYY